MQEVTSQSVCWDTLSIYFPTKCLTNSIKRALSKEKVSVVGKKQNNKQSNKLKNNNGDLPRHSKSLICPDFGMTTRFAIDPTAFCAG